jgi:hypothetical protein
VTLLQTGRPRTWVKIIQYESLNIEEALFALPCDSFLSILLRKLSFYQIISDNYESIVNLKL